MSLVRLPVHTRKLGLLTALQLVLEVLPMPIELVLLYAPLTSLAQERLTYVQLAVQMGTASLALQVARRVCRAPTTMRCLN